MRGKRKRRSGSSAVEVPSDGSDGSDGSEWSSDGGGEAASARVRKRQKKASKEALRRAAAARAARKAKAGKTTRKKASGVDEAVEAAVAAGQRVGMVRGGETRTAVPVAKADVVERMVAKDGADVVFKGKSRKSMFVFALPFHLDRVGGSGAALRGELSDLNSLHPKLTIPIDKPESGEHGSLVLSGAVVRSSDARFLLLTGTSAGMATSHVYDSVVVFSDAHWVGADGASVPVSSLGGDAALPWPHAPATVAPDPAWHAPPADGSAPTTQTALLPASGVKVPGSPAKRSFSTVSTAALAASAAAPLAPSPPAKAKARKKPAVRAARVVDLESDSDSDVLFGSPSPRASASPPSQRSQPRRSTGRRKSYADMFGSLSAASDDDAAAAASSSSF